MDQPPSATQSVGGSSRSVCCTCLVGVIWCWSGSCKAAVSQLYDHVPHSRGVPGKKWLKLAEELCQWARESLPGDMCMWSMHVHAGVCIDVDICVDAYAVACKRHWQASGTAHTPPGSQHKVVRSHGPPFRVDDFLLYS